MMIHSTLQSVQSIIVVAASVIFFASVIYFITKRRRSSKGIEGQQNSEKKAKCSGKKPRKYIGTALKEAIDDPSYTGRIEISEIIKDKEGAELIFHSRDQDGSNRSEKIKHEYISQEALEKSQKIIEEKDISQIDVEKILEDDPGLLVDGSDDLYLDFTDHILKIKSKDYDEKDTVRKLKQWLCSVSDVDFKDLEMIDKDQNFEDAVINVLLSEDDEEKNHLLRAKSSGEILDYERTRTQTIIDDTGDISHTKLPFSHGIEVELQVVKDDWSWVDGEMMSYVFREILESARDQINSSKREAVPLIQNRWDGRAEIQKDDRGNEAVHVRYKDADDMKYFSVFGKDSHVSLKTNILEIQTPPCRYLEELKWWRHILTRSALNAVENLEIDCKLLSTGTNPVEKYSEGVSFGEHHHIGIEDEELRRKVYNIYRGLVPHLIAIASSSPFLGGLDPILTLNDRQILIIKEPCYTMRLKKNNEQFRAPPYLPPGKGRKDFQKELGMADESLRMIDISPFTRFGTIEVRIFDTQPTVVDSLSLMILLQMICEYVRDTDFKENCEVPMDRLKRSRKEAIENGMVGRHHLDKSGCDLSCFFDITDTTYLFESWEKILETIWPYLKRYEIHDSLPVKNILLRLFGGEGIPVEPPISPSQLLLLKYREKISKSYLEFLQKISKKGAVSSSYTIWSEYIELDEVSLGRSISDLEFSFD